MELILYLQSMANKNIFIVGAGILGLIAYSLFRKARTLKNLNFNVKDIPFDIKRKNASIDLAVINPTKDPITLNSVVCDLIFQGDAVGTVKYLKDTVISGQSEIILRMPLQINALSVISLFTTLVSSKQKKLEFRIKGTAGADGILFPVDIKYSYDLQKDKK